MKEYKQSLTLFISQSNELEYFFHVYDGNSYGVTGNLPIFRIFIDKFMQ